MTSNSGHGVKIGKNYYEVNGKQLSVAKIMQLPWRPPCTLPPMERVLEGQEHFECMAWVKEEHTRGKVTMTMGRLLKK